MIIPGKVKPPLICRELPQKMQEYLSSPLEAPIPFGASFKMLDDSAFNRYDNKKNERIRHMKNLKRILSIIGIIILVSTYAITLFFAIFDNPNTYTFFKISIGMTILIPILLWVYIAMYRYIKSRKNDNEDAS